MQWTTKNDSVTSGATSEMSAKHMAHLLHVLHNKKEEDEYFDLDDENKQPSSENKRIRI